MNEPSIAQVCILGIGIVFVSLAVIVLLCYIVSFVSRLMDRKGSQKPPEPVPSAPNRQEQDIPNRQEFVAAVSAAIAESMGKDVSAIRILSIKRM